MATNGEVILLNEDKRQKSNETKWKIHYRLPIGNI